MGEGEKSEKKTEKKSKAQRVAEAWAAPPQQAGPRTLVWQVPLYAVAVQDAGDGRALLLVGGGGGRAKSGIPNGFKLMHWAEGRLEEAAHVDTGPLLVAHAALHPREGIAALSMEGECRLYRWVPAAGRLRVEEAAAVRTEEEEGSDQKAAAFAPDGATLATAGEGGAVRLWKLAGLLDGASRPTHTLRLGHAANGLAFSADGSLLLATSLAGHAAVWQVEDGRPLRRLQPAACSPPRAFLRGGCFVAAAAVVGQGKARAGSHLVAWSAAEEEAPPLHSARLAGPHHHTALASLSLDGGDSALVACAMGEGDLAVVECREGGVSSVMYRTAAHSFIVPALAFAPDGRTLFSVSLDRTLVITPVKKDRRMQAVALVLGLLLLVAVLAALGYR